ncbi:MAG: glycosyltransferase family 39 protein [Candidatus Didemnitutus sp.]|nr:glycosyltransferase family 39 protein [Candidatus Didemnitutus sp.]
MIAFTLHASLLAGLSFVAARPLTRRWSERFLATLLLGWGNIVLTSLLLSAVKLLGHSGVFFGVSVSLAALTWLAVRRVSPLAPDPADSPADRRLVLAFAVTLAPLAIASLSVALTYEPNNYDSLTYHLPRAMFYLGQNSLAHFDTGNDRQTYFPFNYNLLQLFGLTYGPPRQVLTFFNLLSWAALGVALHRLCRLSRLSAHAALIAVWFALTATQILAQAASTTNDLPIAAGLTTFFVFAARWTQSRQRRDALLAGLAAGLTAGTKLTVVFFAPAAGLLLLLWAARQWRNGRRTVLGRTLRAWVLPTALALAFASPFAVINLAEKGQWMTKAYDYTLNRPLSLASAVQTAEGYLAQLCLEPLSRFDFEPKRTERLNAWAGHALFPHWNEAYAFSDFFLFPPDLTEDHVWFGFTGPAILLAALLCLVWPQRVPSATVWLAFLGLGWFATYFLLNRWSLYNQRYMVAALALMTPCLAILWDRGAPGTRSRRAARLLLGALALSSLWLAGAYLTQNTRRPFIPFWTARVAPAALPALPPRLADRLSAEPRINIQATDGNERIFLLMTPGEHQRFTSFARQMPDAYNVFSQWGLARKVAYVNMAQQSSYTLVKIPTKRTAGVEYLGTIGAGVEAQDYLGLPPRANERPSHSNDRQVLVVLSYAPHEPNRYQATRIQVVGLNPADQARLRVSVEYQDRTREILATLQTSGEASASITKPFRRFFIEADDDVSGRPIGAVSIPRLTREKPPEFGTPFEPTVIFRDQLVANDPLTYVRTTGLEAAEGPYPQWKLPLIRWARAPIVRLEVPADDDLVTLRLGFSLRSFSRERAAIALLHNGQLMKYYDLDDHNAWIDEALTLTPVAGRNVIEFRNIAVGSEPDWLDYLDRNPDVKEYVVAQKIPLEQGAREHYEAFGRKEHRALRFRHALEPAPVADSRYYIFRDLVVEGLREP